MAIYLVSQNYTVQYLKDLVKAYPRHATGVNNIFLEHCRALDKGGGTVMRLWPVMLVARCVCVMAFPTLKECHTRRTAAVAMCMWNDLGVVDVSGNDSSDDLLDLGREIMCRYDNGVIPAQNEIRRQVYIGFRPQRQYKGL